MLLDGSWSKAFTKNNVNAECAQLQLNTLPLLLNDISKNSQVHKGDINAQLWLSSSQLTYISCLFTLGNLKKAQELVGCAITDLSPLAKSRKFGVLILLSELYFYQARILWKLKQDKAASTSFKHSQAWLDNISYSVWDYGAARALVCWYHSDFLTALGDIEMANHIYSQGKSAAIKFSKYGVRDGEAILKAYETRQISEIYS